MSDSKRIVQEGYDAIAPRYREWRGQIEGSPDDDWLDQLLARLPRPADVLELGCGPGDTAARLVAPGHRYVGVDLSGEQLRTARERLPGVDFRQSDLTQLRFEPGSFDAVVSLYVFGHLTRAELPGVLERIAEWLRPGGLLLATFARSGWEGVDEDFLGAPMFFGSYSDEETQKLLRRAGLTIERAKVVQIEEPEGPAAFLWVLAAQGRATRD